MAVYAWKTQILSTVKAVKPIFVISTMPHATPSLWENSQVGHNHTFLALAVLPCKIGMQDNHEAYVGKDIPRLPHSNPAYYEACSISEVP